MARFKDSVVWITGGGTGIGRALALQFAREGAKVVVSGRRQDKLAEVVARIESNGGVALAVPCDVCDEAAVCAAVHAVLTRFGRLDVAVANAGIGVTGAFTSLTDADWRHQFEVNVFGLANVARAAIPALRETQGRLVLIGSVSGLMGAPGTSAYTASKFAVRGLGLTLAQELYGTGVSCTVVHPGFVATDISRVDNDGTFHPGRPDTRPAQLLWTPEHAAEVVVPAIWRRELEFVFTAHGKLGAILGKHAARLVHLAMTRFRPAAVDATLKGKHGAPPPERA